MPVAVNCCVSPLAIDGFAGVTAMDTRAAAVTVSVVVPFTLPDVALMVEVPVATAVARPPAVMVATLLVAELHVAVLVRSCWLESEYVPVAVNCCVRPLAIDGLAGATEIDDSVGAVTVSVVEPLTVPEVAVMFAVPIPTPVA